MNHMKSFRHGYSLIEVLVVIAIMAVLATVIVPKLMNYTKDAKVKTTVTNLNTINSAITMYHLDNDKYPESLMDLIVKPERFANTSKWASGPYIPAKNDSLPQDSWGNDIQYRLLEQNSTHPYDLFSFGPEGDEAEEISWIHAS